MVWHTTAITMKKWVWHVESLELFLLQVQVSQARSYVDNVRYRCLLNCSVSSWSCGRSFCFCWIRGNCHGYNNLYVSVSSSEKELEDCTSKTDIRWGPSTPDSNHAKLWNSTADSNSSSRNSWSSLFTPSSDCPEITVKNVMYYTACIRLFLKYVCMQEYLCLLSRHRWSWIRESYCGKIKNTTAQSMGF
jgi:hypothetical protein